MLACWNYVHITYLIAQVPCAAEPALHTCANVGYDGVVLLA